MMVKPMEAVDSEVPNSPPVIMGVLNVTPDSFSDGGRLYKNGRPDRELVLAQARQMAADGAAILDIGGESTRPGAAPVSAEEELARVLPCIEAIRAELDARISVDTSSPAVMRAAAAAGADMLNDVRALARPGALEAAVELRRPVCLMHMQGEPATMQQAPAYGNVVDEVAAWLAARAAACEAAGIPRELITVDPGFGFGKTLRHNLELLAGLPRIKALGYPVLAGLSRKSMLGQMLDREAAERLPGSLALAVLAAERGAAIVRVHDVRETADALAVLAALREAQ